MNYLFLEGDVKTVVVEVSTVKEGQTGPFPAGVEVDFRDGRKWKTAATTCTVRINEHVFEATAELGRKRYQASGDGDCAAAAMPLSGTTGTLTVAPFTFRFPPNW